MRTINLEQFGITIELDDMGGGTITSELKNPCPQCAANNCYGCEPEIIDEFTDVDQETGEGAIDRLAYNSTIDGLESLLLSMACQNIPVDTPEMTAAIETTLQAIDSNI